MPVSKVVELATPEFRRWGLAPPTVVQRGTHVAPAAIQIDVHGQRQTLQYWEGSYPDEVMAERVLIDALSALWDTSAREVRARLENERAQA